MTYADIFAKATGRTPYPYQVRLASLLDRGENVIVTAPTGSGKTAASVVPFLAARDAADRLADRLLYVTPLRILARTLHSEATSAAVNLFGPHRVSTSTETRYWDGGTFYVAQQMGGVPGDPYFIADVTFTTIDQLLSAAVFHPVSLPRKLATVPAGALVGSYLVFDEIHLLEPNRSLATALALLKALRGCVRFALMTATLSKTARELIADKWHATPIELPDDERETLQAERTRDRRWTFVDRPLDVASIREFAEGRTLVVVNTVDRAQKLARDLAADPPRDTEVLLLHSRFLPSDRRTIEDQVLRLFGRESITNCSNSILIATQVVEVGLDISADCLLTELAPMNALVQRAGRCARWGGAGKVAVFSLPHDVPSLPYDDESLRATAKCLADLAKTYERITFTEEQTWLEQVHGTSERAFLESLNVGQRRSQIFLAVASKEYSSAVRDLVRDVAEIPALVTDAPQQVWPDLAGPWPELVTVSPRRVQAVLNKLPDEMHNATAALAWVPQLVEEEEEGPASWKWVPISGDQAAASWLVALSPRIAGYCPFLGLVLGESGNPMPLRWSNQRPLKEPRYKRETWLTHAAATLDFAKRLLAFHHSGIENVATELQSRFPALSRNAVEKCVAFCAVLHDTGKLSSKWQQWAAKWQSARSQARPDKSSLPESETALPAEPLAHTDFGPEDAIRECGRRPPHAVLGALALLPMAHKELPGPLDCLAFNVIARHHGVDVENTGNLSPLVERYTKDIQEAAILVGIDPALVEIADFESLRQWSLHAFQYLFQWTSEEEQAIWPLYLLVSRLTRLADQFATAQGGTLP